MSAIPAYAQPHFLEYVSSHAAKGDEDAIRCMARLPKGSGIARPKPPGATKADRKQERNENTAAVRALCMEREGNRCAIPGCPHDFRLEMDHFWGRGKAPTTVDACWMLCLEHHRQKTLNRPNRREWLVAWVNHAGRHGYDAQVEKGHSAIVLDNAKHPEAA